LGLIDKLLNISGSLGNESGANKGLLDGIVDIFKSQGLQSVIDSFTSKGLGDLVSSWIGKGKNIPLSLDQIRSVLGEEKIKLLAQQSGESEEGALDKVKDLFPGIIDKLTPNGEVDPEDRE
jgi:uncharacterized protein YidB (DUF937 family)